MVRGDVLQIVAFAFYSPWPFRPSVKKAEPIVRAMESLSQVMFKFTNYVMMFAPIGVGAAMAHTIGTQGLGVLLNLGKLIGSLYLALFILVVFIFGLVIVLARVPSAISPGRARTVHDCLRDDEQRVGAAESDGDHGADGRSAAHRRSRHADRLQFQSRRHDALSGDGFRFRGAGGRDHDRSHVSFGRQIVMMLTLMITSKGVAAVPRAVARDLLATLNSFLPAGLGPIGVAVIFGVDELMDMGRTSVNVFGNCLATVVVARWEGEFDDQRARVFGTPARSRTRSSRRRDVALRGGGRKDD